MKKTVQTIEREVVFLGLDDGELNRIAALPYSPENRRFRAIIAEIANTAMAYDSHIKHTSNMNLPDRPQAIITLVNSTGPYKVKRQISNNNSLLIC